MKIALVILHADPARGGAERYTWDLAASLRHRGHDVSLLASSFAGSVVPTGGVRLEAGGATRARRYARFLDRLDAHLADTPYDVVHAMLPVRRCDVYHPHAGIAAEAVRSGHLKYEGPVRRLLSRTANRINARRQMFAAVERTMLTGPDPPIVLCLSEYVKGFVRKHYDLPGSRLATLFNAVDLHRFDPAARPEAGREMRSSFKIAAGDVLALMIAQDFARKGLREAIVALARANDPRLALIVVGKQNTDPYLQLARKEGLASRVIFAGPTTDPYAFYRAADFLVLPTRHDPCSLVVLESLAMGVPVISTAFNGACEIMTSGRHGFVLPDPADTGALAQAMREMLDPSARARQSATCLELRPALSFEHHLDELLRIYREK